MHHRTAIAIGLLLLGGVVLVGCGDEGDTGGPAVSSSATTPREQDRDRIQRAVADILVACQDQDRDRLRDHLDDQARDRLRDGTCEAIAEGAEVSVVSTEVIVNGDEATAQVRLRVRTTDGNAYELGDTWRFRWSEESGWVLSELPATIDSSETSPTTLREQAQDRDEDCETPSTLQEQDQGCDTPTTLRDQDQTGGT